MNLSKIMGSMTLRERRMLNEAVKQRIVETEPAAPVAQPAASPEPSDQSHIGSTLSKDGKVVFVLTEEGWKTTLRISEEQILALVIPAVKEELKKQMRSAKGQGDELHIIKSSLIDPGAANKPNELFLKRDGEEFADPVVISAERAKAMMTKYDLKYSNGSQASISSATGSNNTIYKIGNAIISIVIANAPVAFISVTKESLTGFDDLFGTTNDGKIKSAIQRAAGTKHPSSFKIPLSWAMDGSIMKYMSDSILRGVGIGKIEFKLSGENYTASVKLSKSEIEALKAKLEARKTTNDSTL